MGALRAYGLCRSHQNTRATPHLPLRDAGQHARLHVHKKTTQNTRQTISHSARTRTTRPEWGGWKKTHRSRQVRLLFPR